MAATAFDLDVADRLLSGFEEPSAMTAVGVVFDSFLAMGGAEGASFVTAAAT